MDNYLQDGDLINARRIYNNGKNSAQVDNFGNELDDLLSLRSMSLAGFSTDEKAGLFNEDPSFVFQILGMMNVGQSVEDSIPKYATFADSFIMEQLNDDTTGNLGAQASTVLTVKMYATHQLWDGILDCYAVQSGYNPEADKTGLINPRHSFDKFIALYIGAGQELGPDWEGDMLYALAQASGEMFGTVDGDGEAYVNSEIRGFYQSIQRLMSEENYCTRDETIDELWELVNRIIAKMYIPVVQMLIHSMYEESQSNKVRMYALSVIPQLSQCRPSIHRKLKSYLLDKDYDRKDFPRILTLLQQTYDCLGFSCQDVGAYQVDIVAECARYDADHPLAGFIPREDVRTVSG